MNRAVVLTLAAMALAVVSAGAAAKQEFARPPYAGVYEPQGVDERGLWMDIDELERNLRDSPAVVRDPQLVAFVRGVLCKTVGFDRCEASRIYIINEASPNAGMYPNGVMVLHTGFLARLHSEAELAMVLGHEFAHFERRHGLNGFRRRRVGSDIAAWLALAGAATGTSTVSLQNSVAIGNFSFSRAQETEADLLAAAYIGSSPYALRGAQVWRRMLEEDDALRAERRLRRIKNFYPGVTDSHPTDAQRLLYFARLEKEAADAGAIGEDGRDAYRQVTASILPSLLEGLVKSNRFAAADYVVRARGDTLGWDGQMLWLRAELYRLRGNPRDLVTARQFFEKATTYPDAPPESWRGLGLMTLRSGEAAAGKIALAEYLRRLPGAKDAASIKLLLEN
jgi:beta-barrel assembly-enhancing protease